MRKIGIDYGDARIGIAFSDPSGTIATAYEVYRSRGWSKDVEYLAALIESRQADQIVIGDPINMDGTRGVRCEIVRAFGARLEAATGFSPVYVDERQSTVEMEEFLESQGVSMKKRKQVIDKLSAQWILTGYLDAEKIRLSRGNK